MDTRSYHIDFPHGLGDCVYFAHAARLYRRRGFDIRVRANPEKQVLFDAAGIPPANADGELFAWNHGEALDFLDDETHWKANKATANFSAFPMPDIGVPSEALWKEFASEQIDIGPYLPSEAFMEVDRFFQTLKRPITLLHTKGNSFQESKSVPDDLAIGIYREILDHIAGTLVLLDWDNRVPRISHGQIKHLTSDWKRIDLCELMAAIIRADLVVGVDSGPLHLCRFSKTLSVGIWLENHHPAEFTLPRAEQVNISLERNAQRINKYTRWHFNIVEEQAERLRPELVGRTCADLIGGTRYLSLSQPARDVMIHHWIKDWTRASVSDYGTFIDRDKSFSLILKLSQRFDRPRFVETGCIRCEEDWGGAGFAGYLFAAYVVSRGGSLVSVDIDAANCEFARSWTRVFGKNVRVETGDSIAFLRESTDPIDVLYLDSLDTYVEGFAEHGLCEAQAAAHLLHSKSIIVYDDTSIRSGEWIGKGQLGVPWLIEKGWKPIFVGHQTVLTR